MNNSALNIKDIKFKHSITIPTINNEGKKEFINVENIEEKSFNSTNVKVKITLRSGQCAQLKYVVKTAETEGVKFNSKQNFKYGSKIERFAMATGFLSFKKVISSSMQPVITSKNVQ